jgi:F-type H+-transporting ATPase subunit a
MSHSPLEQFTINKLIDISAFGIDISFSNSALFMVLSSLVSFVCFLYALKGADLIPTGPQVILEELNNFICSLVNENIGKQGKVFVPFVFSIFLFVLMCNILGMLPYSFASTSHIIVTFSLAVIVFTTVIVFGFINHGLHFFSIFFPSGTPLWLAPLMIFIELFTFLARPFTLAIRLAGNMMAGHVLVKVLASFVIAMGLSWGWLPIPFITLISGFEIFVAILQAYIFTILTCVYLNTSVNLH